MLLRDKVPVRDSCVLRSCGGSRGRALTPTGACNGAPASQRGNGGGADANWESGEEGEQVPTSTAQPALPPHPSQSCSWQTGP